MFAKKTNQEHTSDHVFELLEDTYLYARQISTRSEYLCRKLYSRMPIVTIPLQFVLHTWIAKDDYFAFQRTITYVNLTDCTITISQALDKYCYNT